MIALTSTSAVLQALGTAKQVTFSAYILRRGGAVERALEAAAKRGAQVHVRLDGYVFGGNAGAAAMNAATVDALRALHADAQIVHRSDGDGPDLHAKVAVCDGVAYLDDCNWTKNGDTIVREDGRSYVRAIRRAVLDRECASAGPLSLTKSDALAAEARTIRAGVRTGSVDLESEEIGSSAISKMLRQLASEGVRCRVLISKSAFKEHSATHKAALSLQRAGVDVRIVRSSEKFAVDGDRVWIGSANPTPTYRDANCVEWSLTSSAQRIGHALKARFDAHWRESAPLT